MSYISIIASFRNEEESLNRFIHKITRSFKKKILKNMKLFL